MTKSAAEMDRARTTAVKRAKATQQACEVCGWSPPRNLDGVTHGHHVIPIMCGGGNSADNIVVICPNHHAIAHHLLGQRGGQYFGPLTAPELIAFLRKVDHGDEDWFMDWRAHRKLTAAKPKRDAVVRPSARQMEVLMALIDNDGYLEMNNVSIRQGRWERQMLWVVVMPEGEWLIEQGGRGNACFKTSGYLVHILKRHGWITEDGHPTPEGRNAVRLWAWRV